MLLKEIFDEELDLESDAQEQGAETIRDEAEGSVVHTFTTPEGESGEVHINSYPIGLSDDEDDDGTGEMGMLAVLGQWTQMKGYKDLSSSALDKCMETLGAMNYMEVEIDIIDGDGEPSQSDSSFDSVLDAITSELDANKPDVISFSADDDDMIEQYDQISSELENEYKSYRFNKGSFLLIKPAVASGIKSVVSGNAGSGNVDPTDEKNSAAVLPEIDSKIKTLLKSPDASAYEDEQISGTLSAFDFGDNKKSLQKYLSAHGKDEKRWLTGRVAKARKKQK